VGFKVIRPDELQFEVRPHGAPPERGEVEFLDSVV
jgi:hypothetical protein